MMLYHSIILHQTINLNDLNTLLLYTGYKKMRLTLRLLQRLERRAMVLAARRWPQTKKPVFSLCWPQVRFWVHQVTLH
jgi:hypothetical protein